jgi:acetate kinase
MSRPPPRVLVLNGGSSSIRFAIFEVGEGAKLHRLLAGKVEGANAEGARLLQENTGGELVPVDGMEPRDHRSTVDALLDWLGEQPGFASIRAVGHRVVHGMQHFGPERVTPELMAELRRLVPCDPEHLPQELDLLAALEKRRPDWPQVVCFDTAFHRNMPRVARLLPLPRRLAARGVERYGFHGLSYTYLMQELRRLGDPAAERGRVILAHLGSGASLAAVKDGHCIDTSMGFTPAAGLMMGTRTGDLDPGLAPYLLETEELDAAGLRRLVNHESGLLGVSGISADLRRLVASEAPPAAEAVELFCYQARKWIGAFAAVLGGLDSLVFAGGVGENNPVIRARICEGLGFLGVELDDGRNRQNALTISSGNARVSTRVIPTNEELIIAQEVIRLLQL